MAAVLSGGVTRLHRAGTHGAQKIQGITIKRALLPVLDKGSGDIGDDLGSRYGTRYDTTDGVGIRASVDLQPTHTRDYRTISK